MKRVRVLTLKSCNHCKDFKEGLNRTSLVYEDLDADDNDELADSVEELLDIDTYPIAIIEEGRETTFIYTTNDGTKLGPRRIAANVVAIGCVDIVSMLKNMSSL